MAKRTSGKQAGPKRSASRKTAGGRKAATRKTAKRKQAPARRKTAKKETRAKKQAVSARKKATVKRATAANKSGARKKTASSTRKAGTATKQPSTMASIGTAVRGGVAGAIAAVKRRVGGGANDAITLLETDHRRMEGLLKRGEETTERAIEGRRELLDSVTTELALHELVEEQVLYPALQAHPEAKDIVLEGLQEHHVVDLIVKELHEVAADNEQWGAKFKVLKENIEHHIEEEEGEMFRTARAVFSQEDLEAMGAQMAAMKAQAKGGR